MKILKRILGIILLLHIFPIVCIGINGVNRNPDPILTAILAGYFVDIIIVGIIIFAGSVVWLLDIQ